MVEVDYVPGPGHFVGILRSVNEDVLRFKGILRIFRAVMSAKGDESITVARSLFDR